MISKVSHSGNWAMREMWWELCCPGVFLAEGIPAASAGKGALHSLSPCEEAGVIEESLIVPTETPLVRNWFMPLCLLCLTHKKHEFKNFNKLC